MESVVMPNKLPEREFWGNKKVLITGHTGFKGSWLSIWLNELGANICGVSLESNTSPSLFELANVEEKILSKIIDIRNFKELRDAFVEFNPDIIFHMAAQSLVRESYKDPIETYSTNMMGTVNVLEASRSCSNVKAIVCVTTDKCYENKEWDWAYRETEAMGGHDPYSSSKGCAELICSAYSRSFLQSNQIYLATARAGNVIGGGDWSVDRLVPDILKAIETRHKIELRNPFAIRPWQHVLEPLSGYLMLARTLYEQGEKAIGAWNFGPEEVDALSVEEICQKIVCEWGEQTKYSIQSGYHPHEAQYLKLDISKVKNRLGWKPTWNLQKALEEIIKWHKGYIRGDCIRTLCVSQIVEFSKIKNNPGFK